MTGPGVPGALTAVANAGHAIANALGVVQDSNGNTLRVVTTVAATVSPPAVVVGPPTLSWDGLGSIVTGQPTTAQWSVYLVVAQNQYAIDVLLSLVTQITAAIEQFTSAVVLGARPGIYPSPQGNLPAYVITVQMEPVMS